MQTHFVLSTLAKNAKNDKNDKNVWICINLNLDKLLLVKTETKAMLFWLEKAFYRIEELSRWKLTKLSIYCINIISS